jgi:hypothetical protein
MSTTVPKRPKSYAAARARHRRTWCWPSRLALVMQGKRPWGP